MPSHTWEDLYRRRPYWDLPWQKHPDTFLRQLVESGEIRKGIALDLGCGTGEKAVFLAKQGFAVTGVDVSPTAIAQAKGLADKEKVEVNFLVADVISLGFLKEPFDFLLDAFMLDSLPEPQRPQYLKEVFRLSQPARQPSQARRPGPASQLFLSVMSRRNPETSTGFFRSDTTKELVATYNKEDIERLYQDYFKIVKYKETDFTYDGGAPLNNPTAATSAVASAKAGKKAYIDEYLLERIQ